MTRKERKAYNQAKNLGYIIGYAEGYAKGLHDGNPINAIAETLRHTLDNLSNPEVIKALEEVKRIQEEES